MQHPSRPTAPRTAHLGPLLALTGLFAGACAAPALPGPYPPVGAQSDPLGTAYGPLKGESELTFGGSLGSTKSKFDGGSSTTDTSLNGQVGYGRFLTNEREVGGQLIFNVLSPDQGDDLRQIAILPYYRYNFRQSERTWFYAGGHLGLQKFEAGGESDTAISYGIHGGMKSWLTPQVSFFVEPRLTFSNYDLGGIDLDVTDFRTLVGFSYSL